MTALRESIAETLSTLTICLSKARAVVVVRKSWVLLFYKIYASSY